MTSFWIRKEPEEGNMACNMSTAAEPKIQIAIRIDSRLKGLIDEEARKLQEETHLPVYRSDIIRIILKRFFETSPP